MRWGLLVLPQASMLAVGGVLDALAQANDALERGEHEAVLLSLDGLDVRTAGGGALAVAARFDEPGALDAVLVFADAPLPEAGCDEAVAWLAAAAARGAIVGGAGTGAWLLARSGALRGHRATIHWPYASVFAERFADIVVCDHVHAIDGQRLSCAAGSASLDLMLAWLGTRHGDAVLAELLDHFGLERLRGPGERQRAPAAQRVGGGNPKLVDAVALMEANLGEPLGTEDIAQLVGVSRRQLERLFKQHLDALPSRYYLELRLARARRLLMQTSQSILSIGLACGFSSGPHFSSAYRQHFGITPREQRSPRAVQLASPQAASSQLAPVPSAPLPITGVVRSEPVEALRSATTGSAGADASSGTPSTDRP